MGTEIRSLASFSPRIGVHCRPWHSSNAGSRVGGLAHVRFGSPTLGSSCAPRPAAGGKSEAAVVHSPAPAPGAAVFLTLHPVVAAASSFQPVGVGAPGFRPTLAPPIPLSHRHRWKPISCPAQRGRLPSLLLGFYLPRSLTRERLFYSTAPKPAHSPVKVV